MRILVTGVTGFAGGHLAEALTNRAEDTITGLARHARWPDHLRHLESRVTLQACDLCDTTAVQALLRQWQPERIFHLAGYANTGRSFKDEDGAWSGNLRATLSLYDAIVRWGGRPRILFVGSGLIYGDLEPGQYAHNENSPFRPNSPYGSSKAAADLVSFQYTRTADLDIIRARPFNHIGPWQSPDYAVAHFAQQVAAIEKGRQRPVLETGNLTSLRDLTDVRDTVRAYQMLSEKGRTGEAYNVATGEAHAMQEVLDLLLSLARVHIEVHQQSTLLRAAETSAMRGDFSKLRQETAWTPHFRLEQTLADTLQYWRQKP
jgi:GDP-4-dehydro-6-deoxy-D-mannose reductase